MNIHSQIDANKRKSALVMAGFVGFVALVAWVIVNAFGYSMSAVGFALIISGAMSLGSYYFSDKIVLRMANAKVATREEYFDYYTIVENLCLSSQTPMPKLYVTQDAALNAFATGRDPKHAVICATSGILSALDRTELEGVLAHELSHIRNYDIRLLSIVSILVGVLAMLTDWMMRSMFWGGRDSDNKNANPLMMVLGVASLLLAPLIANIIKLAISRRREYLADASAAGLTKYPEGLAKALEKIGASTRPMQTANAATAHLYISNPFKNAKVSSKMAKLFSTHPPLEDRIKVLRGM